MSALRTLQQSFAHHVYQRDQGMRSQVLGNQRASADERLAVYADAYRMRLLEVLGNDYPALKCTLGEHEFERMARACIEANPSTHCNVRWYSAALARHLSTHGDGRAWLAELAAYELAMTDAFDAADEPVLGIAQLRAIPPAQWPHMQFTFQASVRMLPCQWNVSALRRAVDAGETPPAPCLLPKPRSWVVWRRDLAVQYRGLDDAEAWALATLLKRAQFAQLCNGLTRWHSDEDAAIAAATLLQGWVGAAMLTRVDIAEH